MAGPPRRSTRPRSTARLGSSSRMSCSRSARGGGSLVHGARAGRVGVFERVALGRRRRRDRRALPEEGVRWAGEAPEARPQGRRRDRRPVLQRRAEVDGRGGVPGEHWGALGAAGRGVRVEKVCHGVPIWGMPELAPTDFVVVTSAATARGSQPGPLKRRTGSPGPPSTGGGGRGLSSRTRSGRPSTSVPRGSGARGAETRAGRGEAGRSRRGHSISTHQETHGTSGRPRPTDPRAVRRPRPVRGRGAPSPGVPGPHLPTTGGAAPQGPRVRGRPGPVRRHPVPDPPPPVPERRLDAARRGVRRRRWPGHGPGPRGQRRSARLHHRDPDAGGTGPRNTSAGGTGSSRGPPGSS